MPSTPSNTAGPVFNLDVVTERDAGVVRLRLTDEHDRQLGDNQVRLAEHGAALWQGVFDTRAFVRTYANSCYGKVGDDHFDKSAPVGTFKAARWGLHDMYGNLSEWVEDISPYDQGAVKDPVGPPRVDGQHMLRGGSFRTNAANCRSTHRSPANPSYKSIDTGFRIVRDPVR